MVAFFFFNDTAPPEISTLSLPAALPISGAPLAAVATFHGALATKTAAQPASTRIDRKSTRLNSSHDQISYAVFCLKKKNNHANPALQAHPGIGQRLPLRDPPRRGPRRPS